MYRQGPKGSQGASEEQRPYPRVYERYAYQAPGLNGFGASAPLDAPLMMDRDENGDGVFERRRVYIQDSRHSVIAVREWHTTDLGETDWDVERLAYSSWGEPTNVSWGYDLTYDFNNDGVLDQGDIADLQSAIAGSPCTGCDENADVNHDGVADRKRSELCAHLTEGLSVRKVVLRQPLTDRRAHGEHTDGRWKCKGRGRGR